MNIHTAALIKCTKGDDEYTYTTYLPMESTNSRQI